MAEQAPGGTGGRLEAGSGTGGRLEAGSGTGRRLEAHPVGREDDFPLGRFRIFEVAGRSIGVAHTEAGWYAIRNRCPHQGAPLCRGQIGGTMLPSGPDEMRFGLAGRVLRCPWHGWEFDLDSGRSLYVGGGRAATYPVQISDGTVSVMLPVRGRGAASASES